MKELELILNLLKQHRDEGKKVLSVDYLIEKVDKVMRKGEEQDGADRFVYFRGTDRTLRTEESNDSRIRT